MNYKEVNYIDLFAGAGGLSEGFIREGFKPVAHVEMNKHACDTLKTRVAYHYLIKNNQKKIYDNYLLSNITRDELWKFIPKTELDSVIQSEISKKTIDEIFSQIDLKLKKQKIKIDLIIGGPPCQAYSIIGRARDKNNMQDDPRNHLYKHYVRFLKKYKPKMFVFENVPGILSAKNGEYLSKIFKEIESNGYFCEYKLLNAKKFDVLQDRKRVILIGWKKDLKIEYPIFEEITNNLSIKDALFNDLPYLEPGTGVSFCKYTMPSNNYLKKTKIRTTENFTTQHLARPLNENDKEIYKIATHKMIVEKKRLNYIDLPKRLKKHKKETIFTNRFQVVSPYSLSHTVVAHISCDGNYYIYPDLKQTRSISIREAARIQSFPDNFFFEGGQTAAFKQIGNAVPPLMAAGIAKAIKQKLFNL